MTKYPTEIGEVDSPRFDVGKELPTLNDWDNSAFGENILMVLESLLFGESSLMPGFFFIVYSY